MCGDFISMACPVRTGRLRALAARIGYAVRTSRLSDSDGIRFMSPLADVLLDLRDELAHVRRRWPVSSAPVGVKLQLDLLQVLAQRVPHHSSATMSTLPSPVIIKLEDHVSMSSSLHSPSMSPSAMSPPSCMRSVLAASTDSCTTFLDLVGAWEPSFVQSSVVTVSSVPIIPLCSSSVGASSDYVNQDVVMCATCDVVNDSVGDRYSDVDQVLHDVLVAVPGAKDILTSIWHDLSLPKLLPSVDRMGLHSSPEYICANFRWHHSRSPRFSAANIRSPVHPDPRLVDGIIPLDVAALRRGLFIADTN